MAEYRRLLKFGLHFISLLRARLATKAEDLADSMTYAADAYFTILKEAFVIEFVQDLMRITHSSFYAEVADDGMVEENFVSWSVCPAGSRFRDTADAT